MALKQLSPESIEEQYYRAGCLIWKLHDGQLVIEEAYQNNTSKLFVVDCSRQLGKSTWAAIKAVETAIQIPNSRIRIATAFLTDLEQFIIPAFEFAFEGCPKDLLPKYSVQRKEYLFPPPINSEIRLVGLDRKPDGIRGNKLDMIIFDETGYISRLNYLYSHVLIPATTHVPHAKIIMLSTQPETPDHEFVQFCDKAEADGGYVKLDVFKNPLLSKEVIDKLAEECGGYDSTAFRREYLCERIVEEGRAIIPEFKDRHVVQAVPGPYHQFWHRMESLDSGVRDQTAVLFAYYDFLRAKLVIEGEFFLQGSQVTTRRIAEETRRKEAALGYQRVSRRIADNDNLILIQDLGSEFQLHFAPTDKDELIAMVNKVRLWFQSDRIEVHPRCTHLIGSLKAGIWNNTKREFDRSKRYGHFDMISALVYLVRNIPENDNPVPVGWGKPYSDTIIFPGKHGVNEAASMFDAAFGVINEEPDLLRK